MTFVKRWPGFAAWLGLGLLLAYLPHGALGLTTGSVQGTVYRADGSVATGTLLLSWPGFTTSANEAVAAGSKTVRIGSDGWVAVSLAPNAGASPEGTYYTAVYHLNDGSTSTEYWVVPSSATVGLASVRATVMPVAKAVQAVTRQYVDNSVAGITSGLVHSSGGAMSGSLLLSGDPAVEYEAATKRYVDQASSAAVSKTGGTMTGPLNNIMINGKSTPGIGTLQQAITAAGASGSVEIPSTYTGTDSFTNPNNIRVIDLRIGDRVTAPRSVKEWGARCDGVTDDAVAIQAALDASRGSVWFPVTFPAGTCLTSTVIWRGEHLLGTGVHKTALKNMPGQDTIHTLEGVSNLADYGKIENIDFIVDSTVDASATAAGGNNTFPNRIAGTMGGLYPITPAIAVGAVRIPSGTINAGSWTFFDTFNVDLTQIPTERLIGAPLTIPGAGAAGATLNATITGISGNNRLIFTPAASTAVASIGSATMLTPLTPPWYIGNCAIAFPASDGLATGGPNNYLFRNVFIQDSRMYKGHHSCGIFLQSFSYALDFENVRIRGLFGGLIEAYPITNGGGGSPDTETYNNLNLDGNTLSMVLLGGGHRTFHNLVQYGTSNPQSMGPFLLGGYGYVDNIYNECWSYNLGENSRWSGGPWNIESGSLNQCAGGTVNWLATDSKVNTQTGGMTLNGSRNTFTHTGNGYVFDLGADNSVEGGSNAGSTSTYRRSYTNTPMEPLGKLDADFLMAGNSGTPFMNSSDLLTRCSDWTFATGTWGGPQGSCVPDPTGTEVTKSFFRSNGIVDVGTGPAGNSMNGKEMIIGNRIPQGPGTWVVQARCTGGPCYQAWNFAAPLCPMNFAQGPAWTIQKCAVDYTTMPLGTTIGFNYQFWSGTGTNIEVAYVGFQPKNVDTINAARTDFATTLTLGGTAQVAGLDAALATKAPASAVIPGLTSDGANGTRSVGRVIAGNGAAKIGDLGGGQGALELYALGGPVDAKYSYLADLNDSTYVWDLINDAKNVSGRVWKMDHTGIVPVMFTYYLPVTATQFISSAPQGTSPILVTSTTPVANLTLASPSQVPNLPATQITGLAAVAVSGSYASLANKPVAGADFVAPGGSITGNASTASSLVTTPTLCSAGQAATGILANGNSTGCATYAPMAAPSFTTQATAPKFIGVMSSEGDISFSATPTFPATANLIYMSLTGNVTSSTLAPGANGQSLTFVLCQDATGSRTLVWPANVRGGMTIGATASKCSSQGFTYVNALLKWVAANSGTTNE